MIVTPLYAGLIGDGGHVDLQRRIRAQANLAEYAPLALIFLGALELSAWPAWMLHGLGLLLVVGRVLHGWAMAFTAQNAFGRIGGIALTLTMIALAAVLNLAQAVMSLAGG